MDNKQIYEEFHDKVQWYILSRVNEKYLAEDLCSDVFVKVYEKLESFDASKASISTWIFTIAHNTLIDYYRGRRVFTEVPEDLEIESDIEEDVCNNETLESLANALASLDERERDLIIMRYFEGKKLKEIAQYLDISYAYVKILHNKALETLRRKVEIQ